MLLIKGRPLFGTLCRVDDRLVHWMEGVKDGENIGGLFVFSTYAVLTASALTEDGWGTTPQARWNLGRTRFIHLISRVIRDQCEVTASRQQSGVKEIWAFSDRLMC